jgi:hypothetical protein
MGQYPPQVALDSQAHRAFDGLDLGEGKISDLGLESDDQAEQGIIAIVFGDVPGPRAIGREQLY